MTHDGYFLLELGKGHNGAWCQCRYGNNVFGMLTKEQSKMARAALGWSTRDLAKKAGVSPSTVNQFEQGIVARNRSTLAAIRRVFEDAGIEFTNGDKPGVAIAINAKEQLKKKARRSVPRRADNWQGFRRLPQLCFN